MLKLASPRAPLAIEWTGGDGRAQRAQLRAELSPELLVRVEDPLEESWRAAWAMVDAGSGGEAAAGALSNLALLYGAYGRHELAAASWRRVRWPERRGVGQGTVQYYLGVELERLGRERDAARAYRNAASTEATAFHDAGPPIAPAAMDRLADLGGVAEP